MKLKKTLRKLDLHLFVTVKVKNPFLHGVVSVLYFTAFWNNGLNVKLSLSLFPSLAFWNDTPGAAERLAPSPVSQPSCKKSVHPTSFLNRSRGKTRRKLFSCGFVSGSIWHYTDGLWFIQLDFMFLSCNSYAALNQLLRVPQPSRTDFRGKKEVQGHFFLQKCEFQ